MNSLNQAFTARIFSLLLQFWTILLPRLKQPLLLLRLIGRIHTINLGVTSNLIMNVGVAGNRDRGGRLTIIWDTNHHDGVRVISFLITSMEKLNLLGGEWVPLGVATRIVTHHQNINRTIKCIS